MMVIRIMILIMKVTLNVQFLKMIKKVHLMSMGLGHLCISLCRQTRLPLSGSISLLPESIFPHSLLPRIKLRTARMSRQKTCSVSSHFTYQRSAIFEKSEAVCQTSKLHRFYLGIWGGPSDSEAALVNPGIFVTCSALAESRGHLDWDGRDLTSFRTCAVIYGTT